MSKSEKIIRKPVNIRSLAHSTPLLPSLLYFHSTHVDIFSFRNPKLIVVSTCSKPL